MFRVLLSVVCLTLLECAFPAQVLAAKWYVNGGGGNNAANGLTPATAWQTIQRAADTVNPGDEVIIQPGIYFESVQLTRTGTAAQPIVFRAAGPGVIVSGAQPAIRGGQVTWTAEGGAPNLYSTPLGYEPATVLADHVDLFAYQTVAELQSLTIANVNSSGLSAPGPRQGFAWANGKLYIRLNPTYGAAVPSAHVMKVSPPRAGGFRGDTIQAVTDYNWSIQSTTPAYVVLDGFTFESPGFTGVWIKYGNVTVRNCTFLGCRTGVRGWANAENQPPNNQITADVIVQGCEFSQYPAWQDMLDVVATAEALPQAGQDALPPFFWWSRKGGERTSEIGLVTAGGLRWKILGNYVHDTIDGISFMSVSWTDQCEIAYNRFEKLIDNAIEAENHAQHLRAHHNFVRDVFEPFSYQPNGGAPFPASIWFYRNIVTVTPEATAFFKKPILKWVPGCCKIKPSSGAFTSIGIALDGLLFFNNTLHFPSGNVLSINTSGADAATIKFYNNIIIAGQLQTELASPSFAGTTFVRNLVAPAEAGQAGPGAVCAGTSGQVFSSAAQLGLQDIAAGRFGLLPGSPAIGAGVVVAQMPGSSIDAGALPSAPVFGRFDEWRFHYFYDQLFTAPSGALADPDGDGMENVLESLLSRDPLVADRAGAINQTADSSARLVLSFTHPTPLPEDLQWKVEASGDLSTWQTGAGVTETLTATPAGAGFLTETVRDLTPNTALVHRFLRLRATQLDVPPGAVPIFDPSNVVVGDLLVDGFTDGGRTNGADALDSAWWTIYPPGGGTAPTLSVVDDSAGIGSGNALLVDNVTNNAQSAAKLIVSAFPRATLANVGDQLTISFHVRFANIAANHAQNFFRFGPYDSHLMPFTADNQYNSPGHDGYLASVNFGSATAVPALLRESGAEGNINSGSDITTVGSFGTTALGMVTGVSKYTATLTLTRTSTAVTVRLRLLNATGGTLLDQTVTDSTPQTSFNELIITTSQSEADYLLDNVSVNFTPAGN